MASEASPTSAEPNCQQGTSTDEVISLVRGGYCIGCGACAFGDPRVWIEMNEFGLLQANAPDNVLKEKKEVCPFTSNENESQIAQSCFADVDGITHDVQIGCHLGVFAGHVTEENYRAHASSGGMTTWILDTLFRQGKIDAVVHVGRGATHDRIFEYVVSRSSEELRRNAKSRYYPVNFNDALDSVSALPALRFAFVGVPCQVKALRLLCARDARLRQQARYFIGIFCGHQKSAAFAESLAWQLGFPPGTVKDIDFRTKDHSQPANRYAVTVADEQEMRAQSTSSRLHGSDWGMGVFKPKACDWCDDVAAETADIVMGDAWLPGYTSDSRGNNVVITRHPVLHELVLEGLRSGALHLDTITPTQAAQSQAASYRHRHEGLSVRIANADRKGQWHPSKRISPADFAVDQRRKRLYQMRSELSERSHSAFLEAKRTQQFALFILRMLPLETKYAYVSNGVIGLRKLFASRLRMLTSNLAKGMPWRK